MAVVLKKTVLLLCFFLALFLSASAQTCGSYRFKNDKVFSACNDLPVLNSFLHWTYDSWTRTVNLAYRQTKIDSRRWVSWAINPTSKGMVGAQALVAFQQSDGAMHAYTSPISSYRTHLQPGNLSFEVPNVEAEFSNNEIIIYATLILPGYSTTVNQLWQEGPLNGDIPQIHQMGAANRQSMGIVDFQSGQSIRTSEGDVDPRRKRKIIHGVLNAVSWGILMPIGALTARYMKVLKSAGPAWFYLHITCQSSAYAIGVAGFGTGLKLSSGQYNPHRNIGITLFTLGTLQVFALFLRPKPDHKYRFYWNIYHHVTGYTVIILSIINVFKGLDMLQMDDQWKTAYMGIIIALGAIAFVLEALTWLALIKKKKNDEEAKSQPELNGENTQYAANTPPV